MTSNDFFIKKQNLLKSLEHIGLTAQIHGIPRIISNKRLFFKLLWTFFFLASLSCFSFSFYKSLIAFFQYPFITNVELMDEDRIDFPTITICPLKSTDRNYSLNDVIIDCRFNFLTPCSKEPFLNRVENMTYQKKTCYQFNNGYNNTPQLSTYRSGQINGLIIKLFGGLYNESRTELYEIFYSNGFEVFIHNSSHNIGSESGIIIHPGEATFIRLRKVMQMKLSEPYNNCIKNLNTYHQFNSTFYKEIISKHVYTQRNCLDYVFTRYIDCATSFGYFYDKCNLSKEKTKEIYLAYIDFFEINKTFQNFIDLCPLECDTTYYETTISHSYYPSYEEYQSLLNNTSLISKFPNREKTTLDELRQSVYGLYIYFEDLKYLKIAQDPKFSTWDLISNIGGLLGLFLGLSFLSFIDLIQILFEFIFIFCEKSKPIKPFLKN